MILRRSVRLVKMRPASFVTLSFHSLSSSTKRRPSPKISSASFKCWLSWKRRKEFRCQRTSRQWNVGIKSANLKMLCCEKRQDFTRLMLKFLGSLRSLLLFYAGLSLKRRKTMFRILCSILHAHARRIQHTLRDDRVEAAGQLFQE